MVGFSSFFFLLIPVIRLWLLGNVKAHEFSDSYDKFNDSDLSSYDRIIQKFCPGPMLGLDPSFYSLRYFRKDQKCYYNGRKGPCKNNLIFQSVEEDSVFGKCDCDNGPKQDRMLIYHPTTDTCYPIYSQAFCSEGRWLAVDKSSRLPICETNPCASPSAAETQKKGGLGKRSSDGSSEYFIVNGKCMKLGSICGESEGNRKRIIAFKKGELFPLCMLEFSRSTNLFANIAQPDPPPCPPGTTRSHSGGCQAPWEW